MERTPLAGAKRKFIENAENFDPLRPLRERPLLSVGAAVLLGVAAGCSEATAKKLPGLLSMVLPLARKILSSSLETSNKLDER